MLAAPLVKVQRIPRVSSSVVRRRRRRRRPPPLPPCRTGESPVQAGRAILSRVNTGGVCVCVTRDRDSRRRRCRATRGHPDIRRADETRISRARQARKFQRALDPVCSIIFLGPLLPPPLHPPSPLSPPISLRLARAPRRPRSIAITFGVADSSGGGDGVGAVVVVGARDER